MFAFLKLFRHLLLKLLFNKLVNYSGLRLVLLKSRLLTLLKSCLLLTGLLTYYLSGFSRMESTYLTTQSVLAGVDSIQLMTQATSEDITLNNRLKLHTVLN